MSVRRGRRAPTAPASARAGFDLRQLCELLTRCGLDHVPAARAAEGAAADLVRLNVGLGAGTLACSLVWHAHDGCLELVGVLPVTIPQERWQEVHLVLANRNRRSKLGFFVLHPDYGQVWYRCPQLLADGTLTEGQLQGLLGYAVAASEALLSDALGDLS